jgi:hypothetical protein
VDGFPLAVQNTLFFMKIRSIFTAAETAHNLEQTNNQTMFANVAGAVHASLVKIANDPSGVDFLCELERVQPNSLANMGANNELIQRIQTRLLELNTNNVNDLRFDVNFFNRMGTQVQSLKKFNDRTGNLVSMMQNSILRTFAIRVGNGGNGQMLAAAAGNAAQVGALPHVPLPMNPMAAGGGNPPHAALGIQNPPVGALPIGQINAVPLPLQQAVVIPNMGHLNNNLSPEESVVQSLTILQEQTAAGLRHAYVEAENNAAKDRIRSIGVANKRAFLAVFEEVSNHDHPSHKAAMVVIPQALGIGHNEVITPETKARRINNYIGLINGRLNDPAHVIPNIRLSDQETEEDWF